MEQGYSTIQIPVSVVWRCVACFVHLDHLLMMLSQCGSRLLCAHTHRKCPTKLPKPIHQFILGPVSRNL